MSPRQIQAMVYAKLDFASVVQDLAASGNPLPGHWLD